eukprot:CAMPEP_0115838250 /NCGR_PEP_ID=MMETSP0287-20121206/5632_1 /TAXON_ID=412157 /ORGANISM="Chrysochromulina rotalis, Strain UIO044" /LENGTH=187 /DNA_ID=CAMNT_0003291771 /DNA_START=138 /DNA_END=699 /DNA_ORIENTATION=+
MTVRAGGGGVLGTSINGACAACQKFPPSRPAAAAAEDAHAAATTVCFAAADKDRQRRGERQLMLRASVRLRDGSGIQATHHEPPRGTRRHAPLQRPRTSSSSSPQHRDLCRRQPPQGYRSNPAPMADSTVQSSHTSCSQPKDGSHARQHHHRGALRVLPGRTAARACSTLRRPLACAPLAARTAAAT